MIGHSTSLVRLRRWLLWLILPLVVVVVAGCQTIGYYKQAIQGQYQILANEKPIQALLDDPQTPSTLKEKFQLVLKLRAFARQELKLPVDDYYLRYADLKRPYVVWNVHGAPEFSLTPKTWWYPVVGRQKYHGYFSERNARAYAAKLQRQGLDVYVEGVEAYSTLGWFSDPLLNTFIHHEDSDLAETLFHELAHQRVFAHGDTDFNEAFATAVAEEGVRRWLRAAGDAAAFEKYLAALRRHDQFVQLILATRQQLQSLYSEQAARSRRHESASADSSVRQQKTLCLDRLRQEYTKLKVEWGGDSSYDKWFAKPLNNAQLNTVATYHELVPAFECLLQMKGGDLEKFYREARSLAKLSKGQRQRRLKNLLENSSNPYLSAEAQNRDAL